MRPTRRLLFALFILSNSFSPLASQKASQTDAARISTHIANELISALNTHDYEQMVSFAASSIAESTLARMGATGYADYLAEESHFHGALDYQSLQRVELNESDIEADVLVGSKNTALTYRIALTISANKPHKMTRLRLRPAAHEQKDSTLDFNEEQAIAQFSTYLKRLGASDTFSGAVLLAKGDKVIFETASGLASKRFRMPNNLNTRFNLGSMNKMFTSVAILRLVEAGKITLSTPLEKALGIKGHAEGFKDIQIQHLLSHTSGIGGLSCEKGEQSIALSFDACLEKLADVKLNFKPGTQYRYSSDGMFALGLVIEKVTGLTYDQVLKREVFEVANMADSACLDMQFPVQNAAIGYLYDGAKNTWRNNLFIHEKKGGPAGGCYSSVRDMHKFATTLLSHSFLSGELTEKALSAKTEFGARQYGFGFIVNERNNHRIAGHNGSYPGVSARMDMHLDTGYTLIVLSNHSFAEAPVIEKFNQLFRL